MLILLTRLRGRTKIIFKDSLSLYLFIYLSFYCLQLLLFWLLLFQLLLFQLLLFYILLFYILLFYILLFLNSVAFLFDCFFSALLFIVFFQDFIFYFSIFIILFFIIFFLSFFCSWRLSISFLKNVYEVFECYLKSILLQFMG